MKGGGNPVHCCRGMNALAEGLDDRSRSRENTSKIYRCQQCTPVGTQILRPGAYAGRRRVTVELRRVTNLPIASGWSGVIRSSEKEKKKENASEYD